MNKLFTLFFAVAILFTACRGRDGEIGPQGPVGEVGYIEDFVVPPFTSANDYRQSFFITSNVQLQEQDVMVAYIKVGEDNNREIWEPLPSTVFFTNGDILQYKFDYTSEDVQFYLDGNFDLNTLTALYTDDIIFRVAYIPGELVNSVNLDNHQEVMETLGYKF